jgi:hypothetical protein
MMMLTVPGDRRRPGVQAMLPKLLPQPDDQIDGLAANRVR